MAEYPEARFWHTSQCVGDRVYVWGGQTKIYGQGKIAVLEEFDCNERSWCTLTDIKGDSHPGVSQVACVSFGDFLYLYGGNDGKNYNNILSKLDLKKKSWLQLSTKDASMSPMKKDACGMAHFTTQDGEQKLIVMCGYASHDRCSTDAASDFSRNKNTKFITDHPEVTGWTNEIHMFDTAKGINKSDILAQNHDAFNFLQIPGQFQKSLALDLNHVLMSHLPALISSKEFFVEDENKCVSTSLISIPW